MNFSNEPLDFLDVLSILSFCISVENLSQNQQQTASDDLDYSNEKQANYILEELSRKFEEQNKRLERIEVLLNDYRGYIQSNKQQND